MALLRFALFKTGNTVIKPPGKIPWPQADCGQSEGGFPKIHIEEGWAIHITGFCQNCDNPETIARTGNGGRI